MPNLEWREYCIEMKYEGIQRKIQTMQILKILSGSEIDTEDGVCCVIFDQIKQKVIASINSWSFCYLSTDLKSGLKVGRNRLHKFDFIYAIIELKDFNKSDRVLLN